MRVGKRAVKKQGRTQGECETNQHTKRKRLGVTQGKETSELMKVVKGK